MPEQLGPEELSRLSPSEMQEYQQRQLRTRKYCHRSFRNHMLATQRPASGGVSLLGERPGAVELQVQMIPGTSLCEQENCMMWDEKKRRCLDRSVAITTTYGTSCVPLSGPGQES